VLTSVDQIILIKDGNISDFGTFEELIAKKGEFRRICRSIIIQQSETDDNEESIKLLEKLDETVKPLLQKSISVISNRSRAESDLKKRVSIISRNNSVITNGKIR